MIPIIIRLPLPATVLFALLTSVLCVGFQTQKSDATSIVSVTASHKSDESIVSIKAKGSLPLHSKIDRIGKGWTLHLPGVLIPESAIDVSTMSSLAICKTEQRSGEALLTIISRYDTISSKRIGPNEIAYTLRNKPKAKIQTKGPWSLDVIVIDPGHGGQDAGAEGVNGAYEKNVVLSIGRKLRDILAKSMPATKIVMTRDADVFIELFRRTEIANEAKGKLFVSIHCNSMPTKPHPAHGCETYILRPGRNDDAARVARRENASVNYETKKQKYDGMTEDQIIVATMAQRSFVKLSESFAVKIQQEITASKNLADRGVSQAGFFVLVGASMPNVLVETGFLSNRADAEYLASAKGQMAIAQGLAKAIQNYAKEYQSTLQH